MMIMQATIDKCHEDNAKDKKRAPKTVLHQRARHQMTESSKVEHQEEHKQIEQYNQRRSAYLIHDGSQCHRHLISMPKAIVIKTTTSHLPQVGSGSN